MTKQQAGGQPDGAAEDQAEEPPVGMAAMAEGVGAFFLVYTGTATAVAASTGASIAGDPPNSLAVALAFGLVLAAIVGALAPVSGAHLNPAVSVGLASIGRFPWRRVPLYAGAQLAGAVLGAGATWLTLGSAARDEAKLGATYPAEGISNGQALVVEFFITFLLVFVIVAVTQNDKVPAAVAPASIGFALVSAVLIGGPSTGGAVNPVRALGPMLMSLDLTSFWVYLLAPTLGGVAAALLFDRVVLRSSRS